MRVIVTTPKATEKSTYALTISFLDEDSNAVTPNSATWTLTDADGTVINSRSSVNIASLSTSVTIALTGDDLAISDEKNLIRLVTVEYVYDSSLGSDLPGKAEVQFEIAPLVAVS